MKTSLLRCPLAALFALTLLMPGLPARAQGEVQFIPIDDALRDASIRNLKAHWQRFGHVPALQIEMIRPDGNAMRLGVQAGEFLLRYGGQAVSSIEETTGRIRAAQGQATVEIELLGLDGQPRRLTVPGGLLSIMLRDASPLVEEASQSAYQIFAQSGQAEPHGFSLSKDGRIAVTHDLYGGLKVWDVALGKERMTLFGNQGPIRSLAVSPDGRRAAVLPYQDENLRIWDLQTGAMVRVIPYHKVGGHIVGWAEDGADLWVQQSQGLACWDLETGLVRRWLPRPTSTPAQQAVYKVPALSLNPAGTRAALVLSIFEDGEFRNQLWLVDLQNLTWQRAIDSPDDRASALFWRTDDQLDLGSQGGQVGRITLTPAATAPRIEWRTRVDPEPITRLFAGHDGQELFIQGKRSLILDDRTLAVRRVLDEGRSVEWEGKTTHFSSFHQFELLPDGHTLLELPRKRNQEAGRVLGNGLQLHDLTRAGADAVRAFPRAPVRGGAAIEARTQRLLVVDGGWMQLWDLQGGRLLDSWQPPAKHYWSGMAQAFVPGADRFWAVAFQYTDDSKNFDRVTYGIENRLMQFDPGATEPMRTLPAPPGQILAMAISPDGRRAALSVQGQSALLIWDLEQGRLLKTLEANFDDSGAGASNLSLIRQIRFSPDGRRLIAMGIGPGANRLWDVDAGKILSNISGAIQAADFLPDGRIIAGGQYVLRLADADRLEDGRQIWQLDPQKNPDWRWGKTSGPEDEPVTQLAVSADGRQFAALRGNRYIELWQMDGKSPRATLTSIGGAIQNLQFSTDGGLLYGSSDEGVTYLWSTRLGRELVRLLFVGSDWLAITPQGYFQASSPEVARHISIRSGTQIHELDQFFEVFYRPDLVAAALEGKDIASLSPLTLEEALAQQPPAVVALAPVGGPPVAQASELRLRYEIEPRQGGVGEVRVFHNGKLIEILRDGAPTTATAARPAAARAAPAGAGRSLQSQTNAALEQQLRSLAQRSAPARAKPAAVVPPRATRALAGEIRLRPVAGRNEVTLVAFNAAGTAASRPTRWSFESSLPARAPQLHVLAIGINEYRDASAQLSYARQDASDITQRIRERAQGLYGAGQIHVETLLDRQATRGEILARLDALAQRAQASDHVMLFVASHGVLLDDGYHMVTSDYAGELSPANTLSADELVSRSQRIPALSQWLVFDTCHAGGLGSFFAGLYDARVQVMARQSGMHVFASSSTTQQALDGYQGNGLFTHTLLAGLDGPMPADANQDRKVTVSELGRYAREQTRKLARSMDHAQDPLIIHHGEDRTVANVARP